MTQDELKLVLEALETPSPMGQYKAITAIKEALAQAEQFCDANCVWTDHHPDCRLTQTQEPVAWIEKARLDWLTKYGDEADVYTLVTKYKFGYDVPLYITPPQRTEQNFCSRCGKRVGGIDNIHTCTPPMEKNT